MTKMVTKEELQQQIIAWDGLNKYLYKEARRKLQRREYEGVVDDISSNRTVDELRDKAKKLGIKNYWNMREKTLIKKILKKQ